MDRNGTLRDLAVPQSAPPGPAPGTAAVALPIRDPARCPHHGSRTRVAFPTLDEDAEEIATPTRRSNVLEITSGLPDDRRETDEREAARRLRDLRGRVTATRAAIAATPGVEETLRWDWVKAARFYARFGMTEATFRLGVTAEAGATHQDIVDQAKAPHDSWTEEARTMALLPTMEI